MLDARGVVLGGPQFLIIQFMWAFTGRVSASHPVSVYSNHHPLSFLILIDMTSLPLIIWSSIKRRAWCAR